jgi:SPW repeat
MRTIDNELEDFVLNGWSVLLGAGLASAPWYLGFASETAAALNAWAFGATVAAVATLALMRTYEWEVYAVGCAGLWACAAPWVLGFQEAIAAAGAHMGFGLLLVVSAGCQLWRLRDAPAAYET